MKNISETAQALRLRTDFANERAWRGICTAIQMPFGEFKAYVEFVSDPSFGGIGVQELLSLIPKNSTRTFIFAVDEMSPPHPARPILVIDLLEEPGRTFRVLDV